ncbi:MAG: efflux RND transporter permease subunit [Mariprofundales bacterium]|nr:efflux RND transporter permease subunit [Mariprofundales bacterium]
MKYTDIFIRKPVLATTISLLILVLGMQAMMSMPVRQYPKTENAVVTVSTVYFGADAKSVAGFITQPLEGAIAQAEGIDYLSSISVNGASTITATLRLNYDSNRALTEINAKVNAVLNHLPPAAQHPIITVHVGQTIAAMYMGFFSTVLPNNNITDYLLRVVKPQLDGIEGVKEADIIGARQFALRAWLDPARMAAYGVSASEVYAALAANNYLAALGSSKGQMVSVSLNAGTSLHSVDAFKQLAIKHSNGAIVRLKDVANVVLGAENYNLTTAFSGKKSVFIGIKVAPDANVLEVAQRVRKAFPAIQAQMPNGLSGKVVYDGTKFIDSSIHEVIKTLSESLLIVALVVFAFLGNWRAVVVPLIAIPLSLVGGFFMMQAFGYSINLLTLLSLVLAIGLVVDDAIIVVENVDRHMHKEGKNPFDAAMLAARELGGPIIAMTVVLIAAYVPIGFQGGLTGALFTEFAFTLAGAVTISAIVALTLSPMMASKLFKPNGEEAKFSVWIDHQFSRLHHRYQRTLRGTLATWPVMVVMGMLLLVGVAYLFKTSKAELAPQEDQGLVLAHMVGAPNATAQQMGVYADQVFKLSRELPEYRQMFQLTGIPTTNQGIGGVLFTPWDQRHRSASQLQRVLQKKWNTIAGARVAAFQRPALPGSGGLPLQFVIKTTEPFENLNAIAQKVVAKAQASGMFYFIDSDLKIDKPQTTLVVDRDMATDLGLTQKEIGAALGAALGGGYVNYFSIGGRSYRVIPQVAQVDRLNPDQVLNYFIRTPSGAMISASTIASITHQVVPESINRFQQLNSATISGVYAPGVSQKQVLDFMAKALSEVAPSGYSIDYAGPSRQYMQESGGFAFTMLFAIVIVFLALSIQFNSFRDPIIILVSVPLALFGALLFINLGLASINIYTQVGLVTLMGLISKHGILMVQFANELQRNGKSKLDAIIEASGVRLRPILMTTAAMVLGVIPLVMASGAGAAGRYSMGLVIFTGLSIGTVFTLFVVPSVYMLLAQDHAIDSPANLKA